MKTARQHCYREGAGESDYVNLSTDHRCTMSYFPRYCFAVDTPIRTPDGDKLIQHVQVGDVVLASSDDDSDGQVEGKAVEQSVHGQQPNRGSNY